MRSRWIAIALSLAAMAAAVPAHACRTNASLDFDHLRYADVVVTGRIVHYRIVRDATIDHARFEMLVDGVLVGRAGRTVAVTWGNSTFALPESLPSGRYLIALRHAGSEPPIYGPLPPDPDPGSLAVLQSPCAPPFMFESASEEARAVRAYLVRRAERPGSR